MMNPSFFFIPFCSVWQMLCTNAPFLLPMKTSDNQRFYIIFPGGIEGKHGMNGVKTSIEDSTTFFKSCKRTQKQFWLDFCWGGGGGYKFFLKLNTINISTHDSFSRHHSLGTTVLNLGKPFPRYWSKSRCVFYLRNASQNLSYFYNQSQRRHETWH